MSTRLAVIGGDGIGPEVTAVALDVLQAVLPDVEATAYDLGAAAYRRTGEALPDWSAGCCCGCASRWTTTSTCGPCGCTRA
jgi:isocitrate/isopropylmalate dehydrogenase